MNRWWLHCIIRTLNLAEEQLGEFNTRHATFSCHDNLVSIGRRLALVRSELQDIREQAK